MKEKTNIILYTSDDGNVSINVNLEGETVWLNRIQMSDLFDRDVKTIGKHINNALGEELDGIPTVAKFATVQMEGEREVIRQLEYYNLDVIISVGYRVKSKRGVEFRRWSNGVIKDYILKGYAVNNNRIDQLGEVIRIMKRAENQLDAKQILDVIERYSIALEMLDDYDHQRIKKPLGNKSTYVLEYDECMEVISNLRFGLESNLFGNEKDESFKSSISAIYQTFSGEELYPTVEEKAAHLLYFITKNHSFTDGNKRIAAAIFLYFFDKNHMLIIDDKKVIEDFTLVAITIMIAESRPEERDMMVKLVMNFLNREKEYLKEE